MVKRGRDDKQTRTYKFGVLRVLSGEEAALAELDSQHELWALLCAEEARSRKHFDRWLVERDPALGELDARIKEATIALAALGRHDPGESAPDCNETARATLDRIIGAAASEAQTRRHALMAREHAVVAKMRSDTRNRLYDAAKEVDLWWCHREAVLAWFETARWNAIRAGVHVWPKRGNGGGTLKARFTGSGKRITVGDLFDGKTSSCSLREARADELGPRMLGTKGDGGCRVAVTLRASGSFIGGQTQVTFLTTLHRDLPRDLVVKEALLTCRPLAGSRPLATWSFGLVVEGQTPQRVLEHGHIVVDVLSTGPCAPVDDSFVVANATWETERFRATIPVKWAERLQRANAVEAKRDALQAQTLRWLQQRVREISGPEHAAFASAIENLLSAPLGRRDLQRAFSDPGLRAATEIAMGSANTEQLLREIAEIVRLTEQVAHTRAGFARSRQHEYKVFAARVVAIARSVVIRYDKGDAEQSNRWLVPIEVVRSVQSACLRDAVPCAIESMN